MNAEQDPVLHLVVVGFHHRQGAVVESVYPAFAGGSVSPDDSSDPPPAWKHLPSLALPDGAHNYLKDVVYFTLPALNNKGTVFGIASYRQIDTSSLSYASPEITRNTVQKSLVVLCRVPLFTFIAHHLSGVVDSLFHDGGFTPERLQKAFETLDGRIKEVVRDPALYKELVLFNLSASNFIRVYGRDALVLFKLLLLERRVLFAGDSAGWISHWILTLLSLVPNLLSDGLLYSHVIDRSWLSKSARLSQPRAKTPAELSRSQPRLIPTAIAQSMGQTTPVSPSDLKIKRSSSDSQCNHLDADPTTPKKSAYQARLNDTMLDELRVQLHKRRKSCLHPTDSSSSIIPTDHWGFPLALFTQSYILPIYASLGTLDTLLEPLPVDPNEFDFAVSDRSVRCFLAGATNALLQTHSSLSEVIVFALPPVVSSSPGEDTGNASLTSLFEPGNRSLEPRSGIEPSSSIGIASRPSVQKKSSTPIHICQPSTDPSLRIPPNPLSQVLQLSRMDRMFIDHLGGLVTVWYQGRSALTSFGQFSSSDELDEWFCRNGSHEEYLNKLSPVQRTVLMRFPSLAIFDTFVRQEFANYLRSLLLSCDGHGDDGRDFNPSYVESFRATNAFHVWARNFDLDTALLLTPTPQTTPVSLDHNATSAQVPLLNLSTSTSTSSSTTAFFALHPGRRCSESDDWDQIMDGIKKFRDLAADRGRRLFSQGALNLNKLNKYRAT